MATSIRISKRNILIFTIVFLLLFGTLLTLFILSKSKESERQEEIKKLADVEVSEYEGEDLSSIEDFRENSIKGPQFIDKETYSLRIHGLVEQEQNLSYSDIIDRDKYEKVVTLYCVEGWEATILWEGVLLKDLLELTNVKDEATVVIFRAYDGYSTSLSLDFILENDILLAYKMNEVELPPERGFPFQVVAEQKWGYKWAKWVTEIELSSDETFEGYWEQRGYNNQGDQDGPIFD